MKYLHMLLIFALEAFISYAYFSRKFEAKKKRNVIFGAAALSALIQYVLYFVQIGVLNSATFIVCNFIFAAVCFDCSKKQALFHSAALTSMMAISEFFFLFVLKSFRDENMQLPTYQKNTQFILFSCVSKVLYLLLAFIFSTPKNREKNLRGNRDFSFLLFVLPLLTVLTFSVLFDVSAAIGTGKDVNLLFGALAGIFLAANVSVFFVHNKIMRENQKNTELLLRDEINREYYQNLEKQYENSGILVHDVKRHLSAVRELARQSENNEEIVHYIDSVFECSDISVFKSYSQNRLVNVIINRYASLCRENSVGFYSDIRNVDFSFISDSDIVALLDNLLENALEAARNTKEKKISIAADVKNEAYLLFSVENSVDFIPEKSAVLPETTKPDKSAHGFGLKSVMRIAKKYHGDASFTYDSENGRFCALALLKIADPKSLIRGGKKRE